MIFAYCFIGTGSSNNAIPLVAFGAGIGTEVEAETETVIVKWYVCRFGIIIHGFAFVDPAAHLTHLSLPGNSTPYTHIAP